MGAELNEQGRSALRVSELVCISHEYPKFIFFTLFKL